MDGEEWEFKLEYGLDGHKVEMSEEDLRVLIERWRAGDRDEAEKVVAYGEVRYFHKVLVEFVRLAKWPLPPVEPRNRPKDRDGNAADISNHDFGGMPTDETYESSEEIEEEPEHDKAKVSHGHTPALSAEQLQCLENELHDYLKDGLQGWKENFDLKLSRRIFVTKNKPKKHDSAKGDSTTEKETYTGEFSERKELGAREDFYWQGEEKFGNFFILGWARASMDSYRNDTGYKPDNEDPLLIADDLPDPEGILQAILSSTGTLNRLLQAKLEQAVRAILNGLIDGEPLWKKRRLVGDVAVKGVKAQYDPKLLKGRLAIRANREILERYYPSVISPVAERTAASSTEEPFLIEDDLPDLQGFLHGVFSSTRPLDLLLRDKVKEAVRPVLNELIDGEPLWTIPELAGMGFSVSKSFPPLPKKGEPRTERNRRLEELRAKRVKISANRVVLEKYYPDLITSVANRAATSGPVVRFDTDLVAAQEQESNQQGSSAPAVYDHHDLFLNDDQRREEHAIKKMAEKLLDEALQLSELLQTLEDENSSQGRLVELLLAWRKNALRNSSSPRQIAQGTSGAAVMDRELEDLLTALCTPIESLIAEMNFSRICDTMLDGDYDDPREGRRQLNKDAQDFVLRYSTLEEKLHVALESRIITIINKKADLSQWLNQPSQSLTQPFDEMLSFALRSAVFDNKTLTGLRKRMTPYVNETDLSRLFDGASRKPRFEEVLNFILRHRDLDLSRTKDTNKQQKTRSPKQEFERLKNTYVHKQKFHIEERLKPIVPWFYRDASEYLEDDSSTPDRKVREKRSRDNSVNL